MTIPAILAVGLLAIVTVFQLGLAFGAPWGRAAWGGRHPGVLPSGLRISSGIAALFVYPLIAIFILASADSVEADWLPGQGKVGMWVLAGFFTLGALANLASRSKVERIWGPISLIVAVCCAVIAVRM
jgi:hypothetical protein